MGTQLPRMPAEATVIPTSSKPFVVKPPLAPAMTSGGHRSDSPWLRAALLTPSVHPRHDRDAAAPNDPRWESALLDKPSQSRWR